MKQGFVKVAAVTPKVKVADTVFNTEQILLKHVHLESKLELLAPF